MANALNYATEYSRALSQAFPYVLNFGALYNTFQPQGVLILTEIQLLRLRETTITIGRPRHFQIRESGQHLFILWILNRPTWLPPLQTLPR